MDFDCDQQKQLNLALVMLSKSNLISDHLENHTQKKKIKQDLQNKKKKKKIKGGTPMVNILEVLPDHCIIAANEQQSTRIT